MRRELNGLRMRGHGGVRGARSEQGRSEDHEAAELAPITNGEPHRVVVPWQPGARSLGPSSTPRGRRFCAHSVRGLRTRCAGPACRCVGCLGKAE